MDKTTLQKIVSAALKMARNACANEGCYPSEEAGPVAAELVRAAIENEEVRKALLS